MAPQRLEKAPARILTGTEPQELLEMARHFARLFAEYEMAYDVYEEARRAADVPVPDALYLRPSDDRGDRQKLGLMNYYCRLENERGRYFSPKAIEELNRQKTLGLGWASASARKSRSRQMRALADRAREILAAGERYAADRAAAAAASGWGARQKRTATCRRGAFGLRVGRAEDARADRGRPRREAGRVRMGTARAR